MSTTRLHASKQTNNKLRWDAMIGDAPFELYIPKWRVPKPWPSTVTVHIDRVPVNAHVGLPLHPENDADLQQPIYVIVERVAKEHTLTVQFRPRGAPEDWPIGQPYIPIALLPESIPEELQITVDWDSSSAPWKDLGAR